MQARSSDNSRHSKIDLHAPASVHHGPVTHARAQRQITLDAAYATNPERFTRQRPGAPKLPAAAWMNQP